MRSPLPRPQNHVLFAAHLRGRVICHPESHSHDLAAAFAAAHATPVTFEAAFAGPTYAPTPSKPK